MWRQLWYWSLQGSVTIASFELSDSLPWVVLFSHYYWQYCKYGSFFSISQLIFSAWRSSPGFSLVITKPWFTEYKFKKPSLMKCQMKIAQKVVPLLLQSAKANNQQLAKKMRFPKFRKSVAPSPGPSPSRCQSTAGRPPT